jgi:hypothetical protein
MREKGMVIHCIDFGSLWWLRPGEDAADAYRFSAHAAIFNTTGFVSGCRERRFWHTSGVVRLNLGVHGHSQGKRDFESASYESPGLERRGSWNRLLLGRRLREKSPAEKVLVCARSGELGRILFDRNWHARDVQVVAGSAFRGVQETLILASPGAQFETEAGMWEVTWDGFLRKN